MHNHPENSLGVVYTLVFFCYMLCSKTISFQFIEVSKTAESAFHNTDVYGLSTLTCCHLTLVKKWLLSVKAVYEGKDVFVWLPMGFGKRLCYQTLPFIFDRKLGLIGTGKNSAVLTVSPLVL